MAPMTTTNIAAMTENVQHNPYFKPLLCALDQCADRERELRIERVEVTEALRLLVLRPHDEATRVRLIALALHYNPDLFDVVTGGEA